MESVEIWVRRCAARMDEAGLYFGHGTDNAWDEASWLVLHALGEDPTRPYGDWSRPVPDDRAAAIRLLLERRIGTRQPLAYLLGEAWFCGLLFEVGPGVLVPRSPLAELIQDGFQPWLGGREPRHALDLCTGSGCIAIAMAHHLPGVQVDASDLSEEALAVAHRNVARHGLGERVRVLRSDLFDALPPRTAGAPYDLVVSNPPYVPTARVEALPEEYAHEPSMGLVSGEDGLDIPLRILRDAPAAMSPGGLLVCEVGESEGRLQAVLESVPFTWIEFEHGGSGVFTMDREQLEAARPHVDAALEQRGHVV